MSIKQRIIFLVACLLSVSLCAADGMPFAIMVESLLCSLRSSILLQWILVLVFSVGIESYTIHRLLKKRCTFVVPRMIVINLLELIVQSIIFLGAVVVAFVIPGFAEIFVSTAFVLLWIFTMLYIRVMISFLMFAWLDPSTDRIRLRRVMLLANILSYGFIFLLSHLGIVQVFNSYLG